jgi:adenine-specific DNA-methyltransferase
VPLTIEFLKANPFLVLDTKFFGQEFKDRLLASFENLDEQTDGLLIHSENFQALNLIQERYRAQVKCVYIDPPYNTPHSRILYKNNYLHSTWLTLVGQTLPFVPSLMTEGSSFGVAIDDFEQANLACLLDNTFPHLERSTVVVNHHPQGAGGRLSRTHEYYMVLSPATAPPLHGEPREDEEEDRNFMRSGVAENNYRRGRWKSFYALLYDPTTGKIVDAEEPPALGKSYPIEPTERGLERIYPINSRSEERVWRASFESGRQKAQAGELIRTTRGTVYQQLDHSGKRETLFSNWTDSMFNAGTHGTGVLNNLGLGGQFDYPKSLFTLTTGLWSQTFGDDAATILDYFAGSGTTAHAVINMNRSHSGRRKYLLVEMGSYFKDVTKPRVQKVIYSKDWRDGKPVSREGSSHLFKYIRLESYEDALNNIGMRRNVEQASLLEAHEEFREDYVLRYMLDVEARGSASLLNVEGFADPFNYQLHVSTGASVGETRPVAVDLVETFNYLLGLRVRRVETVCGFHVVGGTNPEGEKVLVIWRNTREKSNDDLDKFFGEQGYNTRDGEFDIIYTNGDNNLENLRRPDETWKVRLIEESFQRLMFDVQDV